MPRFRCCSISWGVFRWVLCRAVLSSTENQASIKLNQELFVGVQANCTRLGSVPTIAAPFYGHSDCPKSNRSCHEEILPTRLAAESPEWLPPSCSAPPGPHHARGEGRKRPTVGRCHSVDSGPDAERLGDTNFVRHAESSAAAPTRPMQTTTPSGGGSRYSVTMRFFLPRTRDRCFYTRFARPETAALLPAAGDGWSNATDSSSPAVAADIAPVWATTKW